MGRAQRRKIVLTYPNVLADRRRRSEASAIPGRIVPGGGSRSHAPGHSRGLDVGLRFAGSGDLHTLFSGTSADGVHVHWSYGADHLLAPGVLSMAGPSGGPADAAMADAVSVDDPADGAL